MRRSSTTVAVMCVLGLLAACSRPSVDSAPRSGPTLFLASAAEASNDAGTVRMKGTFIMKGPESSEGSAPSDIEIVYTVTWDFANRRGEWRYDPKDFRPAPKETEPAKMLFEEDAFYMPVPPERVNAAGGKRWLRMERGKFGQRNPLGLSGLTSPSDVLDSLREEAEDIEEVGEEEVDGTTCVRYTMKVSLAILFDGSTGRDQQELTEDPIWGKPMVPLDVWIGKEDKLLRRSLIDMSMDADGSVSTTELELYDYGVPVDLHMPPASETYTPKDLDDYNRVMGYE